MPYFLSIDSLWPTCISMAPTFGFRIPVYRNTFTGPGSLHGYFYTLINSYSICLSGNIHTKSKSMRGSRKFCQKGSNSDNNVFFDEGREDSNSTKRGPSSAREGNAI